MLEMNVLPSLGMHQARTVRPPIPVLPLPSTMLDLEQQFAQILFHSSTDDALQAIAAAVGTACQVDFCLIAPLGLQRLAACWALKPEAHPNVAALLTHPVLTALGHETEVLALADLQEDLSLRSLLAIQVQAQGRAAGIVLMGRSTPGAWYNELQCWHSFSPIVSLAIVQAQLQQQIQQQTCYQTWTQQLSEAVRATGKIEDIFALTVEATTSALPVDRSLVLLLKYSQPLKKQCLDGLPKATVTLAYSNLAQPASSFQLADCALSQRAFLTQPDPVLISGKEEDGATAASVLQLSEFPALLLMPLTHQETVLGFLALQNQQPTLWQPEAVAWVKLIATQLSTAIIQTRTFQQIHALVDDRTAQLQRSLEVQARLYEKTRQQVEQLRQMNQLKDEFLSTMSHELRTPLTSMTLAIRMLRQPELTFERQQRYLDILEQQCTQETNLINDLLALQKLDSAPTTLQIRKIDLNSLICDRAESFETTWANKNLTLAIDLPPTALPLYTNLDSLHRILLELLTNAGKYAVANSTVHLQVHHQVVDSANHIVLRLSNLGAAILPEELPYIFDKFRRGRGMTEQAIPGTGLGLALVKSLVFYLKGAIEATSEPKTNGLWETCFCLTLPETITPAAED